MEEVQQIPAEDQQAGDGHVLVGQQVHRAIDGVAALEGDGPHDLPLDHGGLHAFGLVGDHPVHVLHGVQVRGDQPLDRLRGVDLHGVLLLGELHAYLAHQLVTGQEDLSVEVIEAVVEEFGGLDEAVSQCDLGRHHPVRAQHHAHQAAVVSFGGGDQTVARRAGGTGLDAMSALVDVVIGLVAGDEVVGGVEIPGLGHVGGGDLVVDGVHQGHEVGVGAGLLGDEVEVPGGGVVIDVGQAVGVAEIGVFTPQVLGFLIHAAHEGGDGAVDGLRQHVAPLVGGGEHDAVEQFLHGELLAHFDAHVAAVRWDGGDGGLASGDNLAFGEPAIIDGLQHQ